MPNKTERTGDLQTKGPQRNTHDEAYPLERQAETAGVASNLQLLRHGGAGTGEQRTRAAQQLSGLLGNTALQRLIQRDGEAPVMDDAIPAEMHEFLSRGVMPNANGQDVVGAGSGGFNARFDPALRQLMLAVNIGFTLLNGLNVDATTGVVTPNVAGLNAGNPDEQGTILQLTNAAANLNANPDQAARIAEVQANWQWGNGESTTWLQEYEQSVESAWSARHFFVSEDWPQLMADVRLATNVHLGAQPGDHTSAKIIKTPPGGIGAYVAPGQANNPNDQALMMSSSGVNASPNSLLSYQLTFENNSSDINTARGSNGNPGPQFLNQFIASFNAATPNGGPPIRLTGHSSTTGAAAHNQQLSETRAANVEQYLLSNGLVGDINRVTSTGVGEEGAGNEQAWRRVDIVVGSGTGQVVAAHEFGHMIGLGDEYVSHTGGTGLISGTGNPPGSTVAHTDVNNNTLGDVQIDGAVAENNDNIMSLGNTVRPQHYSTFHNALQIVTGKNWRYGGEGDAPNVIPGTPVPGGVIV